ncbi:SRPBCC family protein [Larkinella sp. VNQ87]|uniref:SRPBCC family protein n=1 Tax=Larkinella sp. VNQ87 TaxID=3400921 RepID=UPI003C0DC12A
MEKQTFSIAIDAPRETVWNILWSDVTYPQWTAAFSEGSRAETDWQEGSKVFFLGKENEGMVAIIATKVPNEFMSFKHIGTVNKGVEDFESEQSREWAGSLENYTLKTVDGKTELTVEMDIADEYKDDFVKTWPLALKKVKELAEQ